MYPVALSSSRRGPLFPPLPEDPISDSFLRESEIISRDSSSSDDDSEKVAKRRRMLKHAESYLRGEPLYLHSARLRGPVVRNPWGKAVRQVKRKDKGEEADGGARKRLKRCSIGDERVVDGEEISPTTTQVNKGKGILTSRGTNTIDDIVSEAPAPTPLRVRSSTASNVPDRSHSRSPVLRVRGEKYTSGLERHNSPFSTSKQTDDETTSFRTPVKKRLEKTPIEVPPVCSPGTFYHRPWKPQNLTLAVKSTATHQKSVGTSYTPPQEYQGSNSKSTHSISARSIKEHETVSDTIILEKPASPSLDVGLKKKKKRQKIDFAAKSPFLYWTPERIKPPRRRKKRTSIVKEPTTNIPQPDPTLETGDVGLTGLGHDAERVEDTSRNSNVERAKGASRVLEIERVEDVRTNLEMERVEDVRTNLEMERVEDTSRVPDIERVEDASTNLETERVEDTRRIPDMERVEDASKSSDMKRVEDANGNPKEQVLNDWLNFHVAASQSIQIQDNDTSEGRENANLTVEKPDSATSTLLIETSIKPALLPNGVPLIEESVEASKVTALPLEEVSPLPADTTIPQDTLSIPPQPETVVGPSLNTEPENKWTHSLPDSDTAPMNPQSDIPKSPAHQPQPPEAIDQAQPETTDNELSLSEAEIQLQSQAASWQNTQYQVLAAQKGFYDALQESPAFGPYISVETPGRDLLRPISFFDSEPRVKETPRPNGDRAATGKSMSSPFKTPGFTGMGIKWGSGDRLDRNTFISPFKTPFGEGEGSSSGTAFTPFRTFATPESSPKQPVGGTLVTPKFSLPGEQAQQLDTTTKKTVTFGGGFGLLDDDGDDDDEPTDGSFRSGFSPVGFGERGAAEGKELVEEIMGFMGGSVWDIDEELKKMAGDSANTPNGTASTPGMRRKGRESSLKKRRLYGKRT